MTRVLVSFAALLASLVAVDAAPAAGSQAYMVPLADDELARVPAYRYANLPNAAVYAELDRRGVPYRRLGRLQGVRAPIRLSGPLRGVLYTSTLPPEARSTSLLEVLDGRLALALDDFAELLVRHDVVEVIHYNMYRPNGVLPPADPADAAREAAIPGPRAKRKPKAPTPEHEDHSEVPPLTKGTYAPPGTRHPAGLAIDVGAFRKRSGEVLSVVSHFQGKIGHRTCGPNAPSPGSAAARELRSIVCEAADLGLFSFALTPNYNAPHADHFHLEIRGDVHYLMYH